MREQEPSRTAFGAAGHRAAHQAIDQGRVFADPLAVTILGKDAPAIIAWARLNPSSRGLRFFIAARSEVAEARLAEGIESRGVGQLVVLGAGLDTFAYRNPFGDRLKVFEVDHPQTQAWKRRRLTETGIAVPETLTYAPVNFETDDLRAALEQAGFEPEVRSFFIWLGVVPYLTRDAIRATLGAIAALPGGGEVVFDYADPPATLEKAQAAAHRARAKRVASAGEPFLSYFSLDDLHPLLAECGFSLIDDLGPRALIARYNGDSSALSQRADTGGHVCWAATAG
jgi:methyltransferase (TIGR00027 family)